jgi:hypothetical protein
MKKQNFQLIKKDNNRILIKEFQFKADFYPYNDVYNLIEISLEFNNKTMKIDNYKPFTYRLLKNENDSLANWQSRDNAKNYVSEKSIIACEKQLKKQFRELKKELELSHENPIFLSLKPIADDTIIHYKTDFYYHDALTLFRKNPVKFLWIIRECGSWLITEQSEWNKGIMEDTIKNHNTNRFYFIDNGSVNEIKYNDAMLFYDQLK